MHYRLISLMISVSISVALSSGAHAQDLPNWSIAKICERDSAPGQCALFENRARSRVAEAWGTISRKIRQGCLSEFRPPLDASWRIMADCIGELSVVAKVAVRKGAIERDKAVVAKIKERRIAAKREAKRKIEVAERRVVQEANRKRIAAEEDSLRARLAVQHAAAQKAAEAAAQRLQEQRELEERRLAGEEASFLTLLAALQKRERAEQRKARAEAAKLARENAARAQVVKAQAARAAQAQAAQVSAKAAQVPTQVTATQAKPAETGQTAGNTQTKPAATKQTASKATSTVKTASSAAEPEKPVIAQAGSAASTFVPLTAEKDIRPAPETITVDKPAQPAKKATVTPKPTVQAKVERTEDVVSCEQRLIDTASAGAVLFAFDSADLLKDAVTTLDALAAGTRACGRVKVTIEGHTDAKGTNKYNQSLSERRAENVANYLINAGVKTNRVQYIGFGETRPVASNETDDGRALNRRIEYRVQ